ncbi:N-acyl homoserine lactonase family protein [Saccharopolyspora gloriosae]|uniref:Glyoxylase-like metal-dependent hydrolase (Beta-lactamase superfamily II) n=1 Tax=Saccharopolyspora gloriosae TaxID=455344 RepID=A0A840NG79_9PSEU|nr:N-acyl homoserine lactonase family protein [Saccharopolyspora gloriosae]MBB5070594.1 glyoxylase-like metal-dependent hydrolase (beta-lactamase superfamily II) [Saccharopolyspora gloriosae]
MTYRLYALRYGIGHRTAPENYAPTPGFRYPETDQSLHCFCWLAVSDEHVVLVDVGADEATARRRGIDYERDPAESVRRLGLDPAAITDVVLTHLHWDHAGNLGAFPNATFHVREAELAYATGPSMAHRFLRRPYDADKVCELVALLHRGRVRLREGEYEVTPGVTVHPAAGHTPGSQAVRVPTARGPVVLASDARHYLDNRVGGDSPDGAPFSVVVRTDDYCDTSVRLDALAPGQVIPGHDPAVSRHYPRALPDDPLIRRLDVAPTAG